LADVLSATKRAPEALVEFDRALALDPNLATAYGEKGNAMIFSGRAEEVEGQVNQASRLSPRDSYSFVWMLLAGAAKIHLGSDEDAVVWLRRSIDPIPNVPFSHLFLATALANLGKSDEARAEVKAGLALNPAFTLRWFQPESVGRISSGMRKAGVPEQ
jgi:tetratricopeptide (TPR) repeat protein